MGTTKCEEWGFRHGVGESEYEVSFGLAPRNGELSPSIPETREPFNSPFRDRNPEQEFRFELPAKYGFGKSKLRVPGDIYPEIKGRWLNYDLFFDLSNKLLDAYVARTVFFLVVHPLNKLRWLTKPRLRILCNISACECGAWVQQWTQGGRGDRVVEACRVA